MCSVGPGLENPALQWLCTLMRFRALRHLTVITDWTNKSLSILTLHLVCFSGCCALFPGLADVLTTLCPGVDWVLTLNRSRFTLLHIVSLSLSNKPCARWPMIRDCFHSQSSSLEELKTSAPRVWRKDIKAWFGVLGVGSICVNVCIKYLMISMKIWRLWYVLCVWDIKVWEVSVSDCGFDKAYGFLSVHICRLW